MLNNILITLLLFFFNFQASAKISALTEHISVSMFASGDIEGEYDFKGPIGELISASSESAEPVCKISSLFRKVKYRGKNSVEAWLTLDCTFAGQKSTYKTHRVYLSLGQPRQKIKLPMLAKNLKNVQLEFRELSLKSSK